MEETVTCQGCARHQVPGPEAEAEAVPPAGIDRRELLKKGSLAAAAALLLAACGSVASDLTGPSLGNSFTIKLSDYPPLASAGGVSMVSSPGGLPLYVENTGSGYLALSRICPHQGGLIGAFSNGFQCPVHGATFNKSGNWIGGQPTSNMRRFNATADASGNLTIG